MPVQTDFHFAQNLSGSSVTGSAAPGVVLLKANPARQAFFVQNDSPNTLYLLLSGTSVSSNNYSVQVPPLFFYESTVPVPTSAILGVWPAGASGSAYVTEIL